MRRALGAALTAILLVVVALLGSGLVPIAAPVTIARPGHLSPEATGNFDQFVVVLMENHDLADIYGPATYMTQLADQYAFSQHWQHHEPVPAELHRLDRWKYVRRLRRRQSSEPQPADDRRRHRELRSHLEGVRGKCGRIRLRSLAASR